MRTTKQLSITIPIDMADAVSQRVASGQYASESEVIRDGLRALIARDRAVEEWLCSEAASAFDALSSDQTQVLTSSDVRRHLAERHAARSAAKPTSASA